MNIRRLVCLLLGGWLGAGIFMAVLAAQQYAVVDHVLTHPNSAPAQKVYQKIPTIEARSVMRHQAGEVTRVLMDGWDVAQILLGLLIFGLLLFGTSMGKVPLILTAVVTLLAAGNHWLVTPSLVGLERAVEFLDEMASQSLRSQLRGFQASYRVIESAKAIGIVVLAALMILYRPPRRKRGGSFTTPPDGAPQAHGEND